MEEVTMPRLRTVQGIPAGQIPSPRLLTALPDPLAFQDQVRLTKDERVTLILISKGCTLREIQKRLGCAHRQAQRHRQQLLLKLEAKNDAHCVSIGIKRGELKL